MLPRPDLVISEAKTPPQNWCKSGHFAPEMFRRKGSKAEEEPTRFYRISSDVNPSVNGTYCEVCLIAANAMSRGEVQIRKA